jgi:protein-S-isoprenylcysteine O-methyltransferase Ste14
MLENIKAIVRHMMEILFTSLLLCTQTVFLWGVTISTMITPLFVYLPILYHFAAAGDERFTMYVLSQVPFYYGVSLGQIVSLIGLAIFCIAAAQWIWFHHKKVGLFTRGLYSKIRHPQFLGIIIVTLGLTMEILGSGINNYVFPSSPTLSFDLTQLAGLWFLQVLGYITIAWYEERQLSKKFNEYKVYKQNVSFLIPLKTPKKIPEILFTIILVTVICLVILLLPYEQMNILSQKYIPHIFS